MEKYKKSELDFDAQKRKKVKKQDNTCFIQLSI